MFFRLPYVTAPVLGYCSLSLFLFFLSFFLPALYSSSCYVGLQLQVSGHVYTTYKKCTFETFSLPQGLFFAFLLMEDRYKHMQKSGDHWDCEKNVVFCSLHVQLEMKLQKTYTTVHFNQCSACPISWLYGCARKKILIFYFVCILLFVMVH